MLKALLADRFKLKAHPDTRELPVFDLMLVSKDGKLGPQMKPSTCSRSSDRPCVPFRMLGMDPASGIKMGVEGTTMREFAAAIVSFPEIDRPVRDRTGLPGAFDLQMALQIAAPNAVGDSGILTVLREQLGLKLEGRHDRVEVIAIDSAEPPAED